jgi:hypothetical protein
MRRLHLLLELLTALLVWTQTAWGDTPFIQAISHKHPLPTELRGEATKLVIDRDGIVYLLTRKGVARLFGDQIALDHSYRPLAGRFARELQIYEGDLFYLFADELLSNRRAGKFVYKAPQAYDHFAVNAPGAVVLSEGARATIFKSGQFSNVVGTAAAPFEQLVASDERFFGRAGEEIFRISSNIVSLAKVPGLNVLAVHERKLYAGLNNGFLALDPASGKLLSALNSRLPSTNITALAFSGSDIWAGTTRGVWRLSADGSFRYFASKRWLEDDHVLDIAVAPKGRVYALTKNAVNEIEFRWMTLTEKAAWYDRKIRQRHIRYGFCAELRLKTPGDITTAEMIDTDNDGTWSNYYMASQAFRYGATADEQARSNAWETFEALERLESINPLDGFPSRTFERTGFKVSDPDRWHPAGDGIWDWKAHTSSDEFIAHMFGCSVLYEVATKTDEEKKRVRTFITKVLDHVIRNKWYLIDVDGQPTLWGRWNPEYVNGFPESMYDRRLNSTEIIAALQFGYAISGKRIYKEKAFELMEKHGYLRNILLPMSGIDYTPGFKHKGIEMGMDWNHSDDLLGFDSYWLLHRYAFNDELRAKFIAAIRDHWELEKSERCPLWNFIYGSTGATEYGLEAALWTLRGFPLDMIDWTVTNSHRRDITRLPPNFRSQELKELLPPDERRITRWNSQPFILDGGNGGSTELAGDEFLLPYWMGRYLKMID